MSRERSEYERIMTTERFMRSNGDINAVMPDGDTPLHAGLRVCNEKIVREALERGAVIDEKAVELALSDSSRIPSSSLRLFEKYITQEGFNPDAIMVEETQQTLLHVILSRSGATHDLANQLVSKGARVDIRDKEGKTAFDFALIHNNDGFGGVPKAVIQKHLERHDINDAINSEGDTLLHIFANKYGVGGFYVDSLIREDGARFDIKNKSGQTALDQALKGCLGWFTDAGKEIITKNLEKEYQADEDGFMARMEEYKASHPELRIEGTRDYIRCVIKDLESARAVEYQAEEAVRAADQDRAYEAYIAELRAKARADVAEEAGFDLAASTADVDEAGVDLAGASAAAAAAADQ